jgi:nucleotidyltransferase AbiEii toxin of type IV toxin-antitoxin system
LAKKPFVVERFFALGRDDQREVLEQARAKTDRPTHLLEKDVWVVWALGTLFESPLAADLTFKGGTSLSKAYKIIDRFSEDIDLTYDIRKLIADLTGGEEFLPVSRSQASKWTKAVRDRLPEWIARDVQPVVKAALEREQLEAKLEIGGAEQVIDYFHAVEGALHIVPEGAARESLAGDYASMLEDEVMVGNALPFDQLMQACAEVATRANAAAR